MAATKIYLQTWGRPLAFYVDKDSIYKINRQATVEEANPFLRDVYFPSHNARFAVAPANPTNVHRPLLKIHRLHEILSLRSPRVLDHDFTLRYRHRRFQLLADQPCRVRPGADIDVETRLDGSTHLRFKDRYLNFKPLADGLRRPAARKLSAPSQPRPGTLAYAKGVYVGAWAMKKGDVSTCPAIKSSL